MTTPDIATIHIGLPDGNVYVLNATDIEVWDDDEHGTHGMTWTGGEVLYDVTGEAGQDVDP